MVTPLQNIVPTFNAMVPAEGPKAIPLLLDFTAAQSLEVDFSALYSQQKIAYVQTLFIDNSNNTAILSIAAGAQSNQVIKVPPGAQAYLPILEPNPPRFVISTTGGVAVQAQFINVPMPAHVWMTNSFTFTNGALVVSDTLLEALIANPGRAYGNGLNVNIVSRPGIPSGGTSWSFACVAGGIIVNTDVALLAAVSGQFSYLTGIQMKNFNATATEVVIKSGATVIWRGKLPATMITADPINFNPPLVTTAVNTALNFQCLTAAAEVYVSAQGFTHTQ